jgi:hypothetical protein
MMKKLMFSAFLIVLPAVIWAQSSVQVGSTSSASSKSRLEAKTKANQMATGIRSAEAALTPAELAIAARVHQGKLPCELGAFVTLAADPAAPGYFNVHTKQQKYRMFPVETSTGAIRLEDHKAGAVWLQLANKSMLMNQKLGKRLADACMNPDQIVVAEKMLKNPAPGLLDVATEVAIK